MNQTEIIQKLQPVFDSIFMSKVELSPELSAKDVEEWDSLTHISLVVAVEETFDIRFGVGEVESTKNIGDFANLIARKQNQS
jgi:acyl carrier protein